MNDYNEASASTESLSEIKVKQNKEINLFEEYIFDKSKNDRWKIFAKSNNFHLTSKVSINECKKVGSLSGSK